MYFSLSQTHTHTHTNTLSLFLFLSLPINRNPEGYLEKALETAYINSHCLLCIIVESASDWWGWKRGMKKNCGACIVWSMYINSIREWRRMAYILWRMFLLKCEDPIEHYLEMRNYLWDRTHILCGARSSLNVLVFSQSANRHSKT